MKEITIFMIFPKSDIEYLPNEKHQISTGFWSGMFTLRLQDRFDNQDSLAQEYMHGIQVHIYKTRGVQRINGKLLED